MATHTGTHMYVIIRLDATFSEEEAARYQDQMSISAASDMMLSTEPVELESFERVENALKAKIPMLAKRDGILALRGGFTAPTDESRGLHESDKYQIMAGWRLGRALNGRDNIYEVSGSYPSDACHQATFDDPKNVAFWSFTVYDKAGFYVRRHGKRELRYRHAERLMARTP